MMNLWLPINKILLLIRNSADDSFSSHPQPHTYINKNFIKKSNPKKNILADARKTLNELFSVF
jgi:hypothetical protein